MKKLILIHILFLSVIISIGIASAATLHVDVNNPACNDTMGSPFCAIQAAVDNSSDGDKISVAAGT
ncbi:MAG TPA: hypothetical protein ENL10_04835, partial [Candidatus Cloacimonetes bacterium]|nr:hypothetical protein [Candidatus Cloacimonadota bacterium]